MGRGLRCRCNTTYGIIVATARAFVNQAIRAEQCDLCIDRPAGPACVEACPTGALSLKYPREVIQQAARVSARQFLEAVESQQRLAANP